MIILAPTEAEATSSVIKITKDNTGPVGTMTQKRFSMATTFRVIGLLAAAEYIRLEYFDGTAWRPVNIEGNLGKILDVDNAVASVFASMTKCRLFKPATPGNAIGVEVV